MASVGEEPAIQRPFGKPIIGLIGGMGSGKSLVAAELARLGGRVVSGDRAGHEALMQPGIKDRIRERWSGGVLDSAGNVDRRRLAAKVFADPAERRVLEDLVFPFIEQRLFEELGSARQDAAVKFIVLDAAIMLEAGWNKYCDRLVYVDAPRVVRAERLARQRGWTESELQAREQAQWPVAEKKRRADFVIDNSGSLEDLHRQVADLLAQWKLN